MRASTTPDNRTRFQPFTLHIEVENEDDLKNLWLRFNISAGDITYNQSVPNFTYDRKKCGGYDVWKVVNEKLKEAGL